MRRSTIEIDTSSFNKFARDLKKADPVLRKALRTHMKAAGEIVAADARLRAGFSRRIPSTIKVRVVGNLIFVVVADQKYWAAKPNARVTAHVLRKRAEGSHQALSHIGEAKALEHKGEAGTFRHPVFGDRSNWVSQNARPFLHPALEAHREDAVRAAKQAVQKALREVHSHG